MRNKQTPKSQIDEVPYSSVAWLLIPKCCNEDSLIIANSLQDQNIQQTFFAQIVAEEFWKKAKFKRVFTQEQRKENAKEHVSIFFSS